MSRWLTGAALVGVAAAMSVAGATAFAGSVLPVDSSVPASSTPDSSVPESSTPATSEPVSETSAPAETHTLSIVLPDGLDPASITVGVAVSGADETDYVVDPGACVAIPACASFELPAGSYDLVFTIDDPPGVATFLILDGVGGFGFGVEIVDADVELRFELGATAPPTTPSDSTTTTTVASAGPSMVPELPETGSEGRLGGVSLALVVVGLGCLALARRRTA